MANIYIEIDLLERFEYLLLLSFRSALLNFQSLTWQRGTSVKHHTTRFFEPVNLRKLRWPALVF